MKLEGLRAFVAVAEAGSISEGARRLNLSKSVVSERLVELERSRGAALIHRTTRSLALTEDGHALFPRAVRILEEVVEAAAELAERRGGLAGPLRLSAPLSFGVLHLGPALYPFLREHPRLELNLDLDDRFVDVAGDGYDAVVRIGQVADNRLVAKALTTSRRTLVASPSYLAEQGRPASLEDLPHHRAIAYANRGAEDWRFRSNGGNVVVHVAPALRVNNGDVMRDAAEAGLGLALLPTFLTSRAVEARRLDVVDVGAEPDTDIVHVVYAKTRGVQTKIAALVEHLRGVFGEPPYWDVAAPKAAPTTLEGDPSPKAPDETGS